MKASEFKCCKKGCDKQAVVFVGMNDPDAEEYPVCREHADEYKMDVVMALCRKGENDK